VQNALGQPVTTVSDCYTGATLSVRDPNNQVVCSQYDDLGRVVETAAPGDTLSSLPRVTGGLITAYGAYTWPPTHFVRDTGNCTTNAGTTIGDNGAGPTTWTEYLSLGVLNAQRTVVHERDGT
jgi:YD repeat-containing protein